MANIKIKRNVFIAGEFAKAGSIVKSVDASVAKELIAMGKAEAVDAKSAKSAPAEPKQGE
jgi:hypothetical protein